MLKLNKIQIFVSVSKNKIPKTPYKIVLKVFWNFNLDLIIFVEYENENHNF